MSEPAEAITETTALLAVRAGGAEFGIPLESVREVVRVPPIARLPFPPPAVRGVTSVRGEIVPVLDLAMRLLGRSTGSDGRLVVVVDPATSDRVGLLVDEVPGLLPAEGERHAPPAEVQASLPEGWIEAVLAPEPDRLVTVLRLAPVLAVTDPDQEESR